jgi:hypothetical protein
MMAEQASLTVHVGYFDDGQGDLFWSQGKQSYITVTGQIADHELLAIALHSLAAAIEDWIDGELWGKEKRVTLSRQDLPF